MVDAAQRAPAAVLPVYCASGEGMPEMRTAATGPRMAGDRAVFVSVFRGNLCRRREIGRRNCLMRR